MRTVYNNGEQQTAKRVLSFFDRELGRSERQDPHEVVLGLFPLLAGLVGMMCDSRDVLRLLLVLNLCGNICMLLGAGRSVLQSHRMGWFLVLCSYTVMFYVEGVALAFGDPSFGGSRETKIYQYSVTSIQRALLCLGIFQAAFFLAWWGPAPVFKSMARKRLLSPRSVLYPMCLCGYVPLIAVRGLDLGALSQELLNSRTVRFSGGYSDAGLLQHISALSFYPSALLLAKGVCGKGTGRWTDLAAGIIGVIPFLALGSRHMLLCVLGPVALVWFYAKIRQFKFQTFVAVIALMISGFLLLQLQYAVRYKGWNAIASVKGRDLDVGKVSQMFESLLFATNMVPEVHRYYMEPMTPLFITYWIPRRLWPNKYESRSYAGFSEAMTGSADVAKVNSPPSIVGQYYINWSYVGVLAIGWWIGLLTKWLDLQTFEVRKGGNLPLLVLCGSGYMFLVNVLRIYHPFYLAYVVWMVLVAIVSSKLARFLGLEVRPIQREVGELDLRT